MSELEKYMLDLYSGKDFGLGSRDDQHFMQKMVDFGLAEFQYLDGRYYFKPILRVGK